MSVETERAIVLIDGEHHPAAVRDALRELAERREIVAVVFCGGSEKVGSELLDEAEEHYGYPLVRESSAVAAMLEALDRFQGDVVIDLADEPIVPAEMKMRLAALALHRGYGYEAPGMSFAAQKQAKVDFPGRKIAVIGTGKRTGKTAVCGHLAGLISAHGGRPAIVSMGRGGPADPVLARPDTALPELLEIARAGLHAASDYLEDAVLAGVPTVGCRRVGGGPGGDTGYTNFLAGVELAAALPGIDCLLFEGSGATVPPVQTDASICVVGDREQALTMMGPLRLMRSQLVLVPALDPDLARDVRAWTDGEVVPFELLPEPVEPVPEDATVAFFTTGPSNPPTALPLVVSRNLARRAELTEDLERAAALGCDVYLTELKAAAIDMVAEHAERHGARVVFVRNRPVGDGVSLDDVLINLYDAIQPAAAR